MGVKPSDIAKVQFRAAWSSIAFSHGEPERVATSLAMMAQGLESLTIGLRATYMKLEEIEALLKKQNLPRK
jgi:hypothetical protein